MKKNTEENIKAFEGQRDGEEFLFVFRKHIISMRKGFYLFLGSFAISCLPVFISIAMNNASMDIFNITIAGFFVGLALFCYHFMIWYFSIYIVTDQRIRQITQKGFFAKTVIDLPLSKIQSINYSISGFFASIFHFGTINILTIVGDLEIKNVEHPEKIYNKLQDAVGDLIEEENEEY